MVTQSSETDQLGPFSVKQTNSRSRSAAVETDQPPQSDSDGEGKDVIEHDDDDHSWKSKGHLGEVEAVFPCPLFNASQPSISSPQTKG